jgi:NAD(P)-dependent dehydrogenase (short-subunit alcohol dehydrogenase family)
MARTALTEFGTVDILVNNAGNLIYKPLVPLPDRSPTRSGTPPSTRT